MTEQEKKERAAVLANAMTFIGTPYHHAARVKGGGVDCATFLCMAFEEIGLESPIVLDKYQPDWFLMRNDERYLDKLLSRAVEITEQQALAADIVLYQFGRCFAHGGIIIDPGWPMIIHAYHRARYVTISEGNNGDFDRRPRRFFRRKGWTS
jgi:cell wall-associated NlpC family hydrolase